MRSSLPAVLLLGMVVLLAGATSSRQAHVRSGAGVGNVTDEAVPADGVREQPAAKFEQRARRIRVPRLRGQRLVRGDWDGPVVPVSVPAETCAQARLSEIGAPAGPQPAVLAPHDAVLAGRTPAPSCWRSMRRARAAAHG